jgi:hypothetical protein
MLLDHGSTMTLSQGPVCSSDYNDNDMTANVSLDSRVPRLRVVITMVSLVGSHSLAAGAQTAPASTTTTPPTPSSPSNPSPNPTSPTVPNAKTGPADPTTTANPATTSTPMPSAAMPSAAMPSNSAPAAGQPSLPPPYPTAEPLPPVPVDTEPSRPGPELPEAEEPAIHEPPLPQSYLDRQAGEQPAPVPPPQPNHVAPRSSFWIGARPGIMVPMGSAWLDGLPVGDLCCVESARPFAEFASTGPSLGAEAGVRFGRHYQGFAYWEHAWLGAGTLGDAFGGQTGANSSVFGGGFRFNTHPDHIGMVVEISLGYRTFEAEWQNGTRLTASDDLFSTQLGFGAAWRINRYTSLELLLRIGGGSLTDIQWRFADGTTENALSVSDRYGQYIPFGIQLASHWDVIRSDD